ADQCQGLNEGDAQEHGGTELSGHLGLACHALECLTDQDADADAGADGSDTVANCAVVSDCSNSVSLSQDDFVHENVVPFLVPRWSGLRGVKWGYSVDRVVRPPLFPAMRVR